MAIARFAFFLALVVAETSVCPTEKEKLFYNWIEKSGGHVNPKVELSTGPDPEWNVRGVFAKENIEREETLAVIPIQVSICASAEQADPDCEIALKILAERSKGEDSFYWPYLQLLEGQVPIVFTQQESPLLEGLPPYDFLKLEERITECGLDATPASLRLLALVRARIMTIDDTPCMVPFWDNFNHHRMKQNLMWGRQPEIFLQAYENISKGSQVWSEFNQNTPTLFSTYGFVEPSPNVWFFDGKDGVRYFFDVSDDDVVEIHPDPLDGELQDLHKMQIQLLETLLDFKEREHDFHVAAAAYTGSSRVLDLISSYRASFERALGLAAVALRQHVF